MERLNAKHAMQLRTATEKQRDAEAALAEAQKRLEACNLDGEGGAPSAVQLQTDEWLQQKLLDARREQSAAQPTAQQQVKRVDQQQGSAARSVPGGGEAAEQLDAVDAKAVAAAELRREEAEAALGRAEERHRLQTAALKQAESRLLMDVEVLRAEVRATARQLRVASLVRCVCRKRPRFLLVALRRWHAAAAVMHEQSLLLWARRRTAAEGTGELFAGERGTSGDDEHPPDSDAGGDSGSRSTDPALNGRALHRQPELRPSSMQRRTRGWDAACEAAASDPDADTDSMAVGASASGQVPEGQERAVCVLIHSCSALPRWADAYVTATFEGTRIAVECPTGHPEAFALDGLNFYTAVARKGSAPVWNEIHEVLVPPHCTKLELCVWDRRPVARVRYQNSDCAFAQQLSRGYLLSCCRSS